MNKLTKFICGLAKVTEPFRHLLKEEGQWEWKEKHDLGFEQVQKNVQQIINISHFNLKEIADCLRR